MTHTPGPWTAHDSPVDGAYPISTAFGDHRICIAHAHGVFEEPGRIEAQANARLIAAAPELLEALKRIMAAVNYGGIKMPAVIGIQASTAIAKAEG